MNGYTNTETYLVASTLDNDESWVTTYVELALEQLNREAEDHNNATEDGTEWDRVAERKYTVANLAEQLEEHSEYYIARAVGACDYNDAWQVIVHELLGKALEEVDWVELAEGYVESALEQLDHDFDD